MGGCACKLDFLDLNQQEHNPEQLGNDNNKMIKSSLFNQQEQNQINEIKSNLMHKLPQLGETIQINDLNQIIGIDTQKYINNKKLDYSFYLPPTVTYKSQPIKFFNNGSIYLGNWNSNCEMEGYGIYYLKDQNVTIEGVWKEGSLVFGRIFQSNGDIYEGEIYNSLYEGKGTLILSNGEKYKGEFSRGEMNGKGTYAYQDGTVYTGNFKGGLFQGRGKMKWGNGTEYDGNFSESYLEGNGSIFNLNGEKYVGCFNKNEFNGKGEYTFNNGDVYEGNFEYGVKKGKGKYKRNDKVIFDCNWNNDLPDGEGIIEYRQNKLKGYWRNGLMIDRPEIEEGDMSNFNGFDLNIKPCRPSLCILSLPHLGTNSNNISQYIPGKDLSFLIK